MIEFCSVCGFSLDESVSCPWCGFELPMDIKKMQELTLFQGFKKDPSIDDRRSTNFVYQIKSALLSKCLTICGQSFFGIRLVNMSHLIARDDVRDMCNSNLCQAYGTNWTCPPAVGSIADCQEKLASFSYCILLQTVGRLEDSFDYQQMMRIEQKHNQQLFQCRDQIRLIHKDAFALGAGSCRLCSICTYPNNPCVQPQKAMPSMESFGLMVSEICKQANLTYYYGPNTISFIGCLLI